ncbi:MAG: hypothetical protein LAO24_16650 [Acidobacteriia bacterium]|nr:hypothetical protein [Terriglobia bacterium]
MNEPYCEKERQVIAAFCGGQRDPEILAHAQTCPVCSEVLLVSESLQKEMALAEHELAALPDAGLIWRKARALAREEALARATRPIQLVRTCAYVAAAFAAVWLGSAFPPTAGWPDLSLKNLGSGGHLWPAALGGTPLLLGLTGTLIFVGLSSWYMLREE